MSKAGGQQRFYKITVNGKTQLIELPKSLFHPSATSHNPLVIWKNMAKNQPWFFAFNCCTYLLAGVGGVFLCVLLAVKMRWTNVDGEIDQFDGNFAQTQSNLFHQAQVLGAATASASLTHADSTTSSGSATLTPFIFTAEDKLAQLQQEIARQQEQLKLHQELLCSLSLLGHDYPQNILPILQHYQQTQNLPLTTKMLAALQNNLSLDQNTWSTNLNTCLTNFDAQTLNEVTLLQQIQALPPNQNPNVFVWHDAEHWPILADAILKDQTVIQQAADLVGIDARLIVACLTGEQVRLFNSQRELFKQFFSPMKILANSSTISLGTMGMKPSTGEEIERHLKDKHSPYYLGAQYENLLDFKTSDHGNERYARLTDQNNHFYSYLYAALYLKQFLTQWQKAGFPLDDRPEILITLYNVGFPQSKPNPTPKVGGSAIQLGDQKYTFGRLGYEFYYSGALMEQFPLTH